MARPKKATVDYFPHTTSHGKTMFILESKWGNDGFAVWFKLLEKMGKCDGLFLDLREETEIVYQAARSHVSETLLIEILGQLAYLKAIDRELWKHRIVWSQHFVDGVADAFKRRKVEVPTIDGVYVYLNTLGVAVSGINADINPEIADSNPQMKLDEIKGNKKEDATPATKTELVLLEAFDDNEDRIKKLFPEHNFAVVKECCLAFWRSKAVPLDPYLQIVNWFKKEHLQPSQPKSNARKWGTEEPEDADKQVAYIKSLGYEL